MRILLGVYLLLGIGVIDCQLPKAVEKAIEALKEICANRYMPLTSVKQVQLMAQILIKKPKICEERFRASFHEIIPVLRFDSQLYLCNTEKIQQVSNYHLRFIAPPMFDEGAQDDMKALQREIDHQTVKVQTERADGVEAVFEVESIPISLKLFFKAWALQYSGLCKKILYENLSRAVQDKFGKDDVLLLNLFTDGLRELLLHNAQTGQVEVLDFRGIVDLPKLDTRTRPELQHLRKQISQLDLEKQPELAEFFHLCREKFRPIYSKLILPVVVLAKLGYDYMGPKLDRAYGMLKDDAQIRAWAALTAVCEMQLNQERRVSRRHSGRLLDYWPTINLIFDDKLWIKDNNELDKEIERIENSHSKGLTKALYMAKIQGDKFASMLDLTRSAWFRRNRAAVAVSLGMVGGMATFGNICTKF